MTCFTGLCAFPITPADAHGRIEASGLRALLDRLTDARVDLIGLLGSTGTYAYLCRVERRRAIEIAVEQVAGKAPILVGIGALRTDDAVRLGQDAKAAGADAVLLAPVSYTPLTDDEVFTHFQTVAKAVGLPLCIYDNPATTHFAFGTDLIARLSRVANIAAVKHPAAGASEVRAQLQILRGCTRPGFAVGYSVDCNATEAMLAGGDAWYSVAAGLFPKSCLGILSAVRRGDEAEARALHASLQPLWALFQEFGSLRVMITAANLLGLCRSAPPLPLLPLPAPAQARIRETIASLE